KTAHSQAPLSFTARTVASGAAESLTEVIGNMATLPTLDPFPNIPEVRPLPSPGVTRLPRYYQPLSIELRLEQSLPWFYQGIAKGTVAGERGYPIRIHHPVRKKEECE